MVRWRRPARNVPFALFVGGVFAYGAVFAWYLLDRFDVVNLVRDVNYDDAFYYFQIAYHMAEGEFSTFDGGLTRTNGYHPLWLFLITPFYWVFDKMEALSAIKAFEVMLVAGGVALVAAAARVARLPWVLLFAALPALYGNPALFRGMEAAAALFLLGLFVLAVCLFVRDPGRWRWPLAAVAFALPWVRLEYVAISVAATAALCLLEWSRRDGPERAPAGERVRSMLSGAGVPFLAAGASLLVYFTYNAAVFGGAVPVNAATKLWWSQLFWEQEGGYSLTENVQAFLRMDFFDDELLIALEICVYAAVVWWFSRRSRGQDDWLLLAFLVGVFGLAAGHLAKFAQSVLTVHPSNEATFYWYFVPAYLMAALVVPARCYVAVWFVRRFLGPRLRRVSRIPSLGIVVLGAAFLLATADFTAPFRFVDRMSRSTHIGGILVSRMNTPVVDRLIPEDGVVGAWGEGVIGYFSRFPVMNLDGLANSLDYLRAQKEGTTAAFFRRFGVTHFTDVLPTTMLPAPPIFEGPYFPAGKEKSRFLLYTTEPPEASWGGGDGSGWFWERMEPHLELQADGVGLLVDGRMAQAFARDCTPAEVVVWTGSDGKTLLLPWTQTSSGLCASAIVLPHDVPSVRAAAMTVGEYLADRVGERRPAIRSDFDVYLVDNRLVYVREPCGPEDADAPFFLHVAAVDPDDLSPARRGHGFDNLDFGFNVYGGGPGVRVGGTCLVEVRLPEYDVATITTGQSVAEEGGFRQLWTEDIRVGPDGAALGEHLAGRVEGRRPAIDSDFDVHLVDGALIYVKESCGPEDVDAAFFLAVEAVDPDDLPAARRGHGFDNLDFRFAGRGARFDGACLAEAPLPEYDVAAIMTGQVEVVDGGYRQLWAGEIHFGPDEAEVGERLAGRVAGRRPAIESDFDVYLVDNTLIYAKESCGPEDVDAAFFLAVEAVDPDDLPGPRRRHGFDNLDFRFDERGARFDGACLAAARLPEYGIAAIRTGQVEAVDGGFHHLWEGEIRPGSD